jgi:hypothetical protein
MPQNNANLARRDQAKHAYNNEAVGAYGCRGRNEANDKECDTLDPPK